MYRGISSLALDDKGRMSVPSKHRQRLQQECEGNLVITLDPDLCLLIYPLPAWEAVEEKINALSSTNRNSRGLKRMLLGHAEDCQIDKSGRVLIPPMLRNYAQLDKQVVLVGQGKKFELWDAQAWEKQREDWQKFQEVWQEFQKAAEGQAGYDSLSF